MLTTKNQQIDVRVREYIRSSDAVRRLAEEHTDPQVKAMLGTFAEELKATAAYWSTRNE